MKALRILLVTRRFWPLVGDSEDAIADLAVGLRRHGADPTVLTVRWGADWPTTSNFEGTPVHRLPLRPGRAWWELLYMLTLTRWLRRHRREFDVVVAARLRQEAWSSLWAFRRSPIPVVLRAETDDYAWHDQSPLGIRCRSRCGHAAAIVVRDQATRRASLAAGYRPGLLHEIPDGIPPPAAGNGALRTDTRMALAAVNQDLSTAVDAPVAVYVGRLQRRAGLSCLVQAWEQVVRHWPTAKLWLIGDGPYRDKLYRLIRDRDLRHCVLMPGTFESPEAVLQAANLLVQPGPALGLPRILLSAAAAGLPIVAGGVGDINQHPILSQAATLVDRDDVQSWARTLIQCLQSLPDQVLLDTQRREVLRKHTMSRMIQQHLHLFRQLVAERVSR
jgi:glycosyltransferase involved in cell wall biosynthesis